jgi:hypothetical protein
VTCDACGMEAGEAYHDVLLPSQSPHEISEGMTRAYLHACGPCARTFTMSVTRAAHAWLLTRARWGADHAS